VRILVTGHRGNVGVAVAGHLERLGHEVTGFDRVDGMDLLDRAEVRHTAPGCGAVVRLGALPHDTRAAPEQIMALNVPGTWRHGRIGQALLKHLQPDGTGAEGAAIGRSHEM
jgi:nucleoside-diphosphate-sugar epimerase